MPDDYDRDRISKLETKQDYQTAFNEEALTRLSSIEDKVTAIDLRMAGNTGFLRGVIFAVTAIGGIIGASIAEIWNHFSSR